MVLDDVDVEDDVDHGEDKVDYVEDDADHDYLVHVHLVANVEVGDVGGNHWLPLKVCHTLQKYNDKDDNNDNV